MTQLDDRFQTTPKRSQKPKEPPADMAYEIWRQEMVDELYWDTREQPLKKKGRKSHGSL